MKFPAEKHEDIYLNILLISKEQSFLLPDSLIQLVWGASFISSDTLILFSRYYRIRKLYKIKLDNWDTLRNKAIQYLYS